MPELTRNQFTDQVIEMIRAKFPLAKVARAEESFSLRVNGHVAPLENLYRIAKLRPDTMRHDVERWAVELIRAGEGSPDNDAAFDDVKERILPLLISHAAPEAHLASAVTEPLVADLHIAYVLDSDRTIRYLQRANLARWHKTIEELHEVAIENLVARSEALNAHAAQDEQGRINLILFQTMDGFDAARILLPTLHERLREHLGSPFAAAIPNRDILLCFRDDEQTVERVSDQVAEDYRQMPHQVTSQILLITADGIAPRE
jgi:hypothetical protein